jgi:hypothetical protein
MKNIIICTITILIVFSINAFAQVPAIGLVAYYPFSGNANDISGNGYNGVVNGATLITDRFGNTNSAYSFNGVSNYIDLSSYVSNLNFQQPATISSWIFTEFDTGMAIFALNGGGSLVWASEIYIGNNVTGTLTNELVTFSQIDTTTDYYIAGFTTTNRALLIGTGWHNIVLVCNDTLTKLYLDNNLTSLTCNHGINNGHYGNLTVAGYATLGAENYNNGYHAFYHGLMDDIRIYNIALNAAQVDSLYHETSTSAEITPKDIDEIHIYSDPANNKSTIELQGFNVNQKNIISIYNIQGLKIMDFPLLKDKIEIDISGLTKGIYILKIINSEKIQVSKFVKE